MARDLLCAGLHLRDLGTEALTWDELYAFVAYAPPDSAVRRATDPDAWITPETRLLSKIEHGLRVLFWAQTTDASQPPERWKNYPELLPLTKEERDADEARRAPEYEAVPISEMADFLGWNRDQTSKSNAP